MTTLELLEPLHQGRRIDVVAAVWLRQTDLTVRWRDEALAVTCSNPALKDSCGFIFVEERN